MTMRHTFVALALFGALALGCAPQTGTATLTLARDGGLSFTVENNADSYAVTLTAGQVAIDDVNLVDESSPVQTPLLDAPQVFDFVAAESLSVEPVALPPKGFQQLHVFVSDASAGALAGLALRLSADVTLTDGSQAALEVSLPLGERTAQELPAAIAILKRDNTDVEAVFDHKLLLGKIDFDALAVGGVITLAAGTGDAAVDAALETLRLNLVTAFRFDGPTGSEGN
jgi:hypothetical protein